MHASNSHLPIHDERGGAAMSIISVLLGAISLVTGTISCLVGIGMALDGEGAGFLVGLGLVGIAQIAGGVALIRIRNGVSGVSGTPTDHLSRPGTKVVATGPSYDIISREVIAGPRDAGPAPAPAPAPVPAGGDGVGHHVAAAPGSAATEVASLILRSDDVFATLKDLVRHERSGGPTSHRHLADMLESAGVMDWDGAPATEAIRLTRNGHFWLRHATRDLSDEDYDRFVAAEAALCVDLDLNDPATTHSSVEEAQGAVSRLMGALVDQTIRPYDFAASLGTAYPGVDARDTPGEWLVRTSLSSAAECAVTPFRVIYDLQANVEEGLVVLSLEAPRPRCMAIFSGDGQARVAMARAYALRLSTLLARQALSVSDKVTTVVVNCHERGSGQTLLSIRFSADLVAKLLPVARGSAIERNGFPTDEAIRAGFGADGWFVPVEAFCALDDESVFPAWRLALPELTDRRTSERLASLTGARVVSELGVNESAGRISAWDEIEGLGWESTQDAVAKLVEMRNATGDITVAEACNRVIEALVGGSIDATDKDGMRDLILHGTTLERAVRRAEGALDESDGPGDPGEAARVLTEALAPVESVGAYLDDADTLYRYFGSLSERINFNLHLNDRARVVRLVPDAYYNALSSLSVAYDELGEGDKALRCADEMVRIAPTSVHATMRKVRVLERQSRIFEAADLIKSILRYASTARDAAICHYRLAYMEWKLGREDLTLACYQRALSWDTDVSNSAREELDDLLKANEHLKRLPDGEVVALLEREGIPLGFDDADRQRALTSATLCTDEGIFWAARPLVGVIFGSTGDDVMMGVYRSLSSSS